MNFAKSARIRVKDQWSEIRGFGAALHNHRRKSVIFAKVLPRSPLEIRYSVAVEPSFPLTLTLSPGEREQPPPGACCAPTGLANSVAGMAPQRRWTILPLPRGEGRGEGKENAALPMFDGRCSMFEASEQERFREQNRKKRGLSSRNKPRLCQPNAWQPRKTLDRGLSP